MLVTAPPTRTALHPEAVKPGNIQGCRRQARGIPGILGGLQVNLNIPANQNWSSIITTPPPGVHEAAPPLPRQPAPQVALKPYIYPPPLKTLKKTLKT